MSYLVVNPKDRFSLDTAHEDTTTKMDLCKAEKFVNELD